MKIKNLISITIIFVIMFILAPTATATTYAIVVDADGLSVDSGDGGIAFVIVVDGEPQYWTLRPGDRLIFDDWQTALTMIRPRWDGARWVESGITPSPPPVDTIHNTTIIDALETDRPFIKLGGGYFNYYKNGVSALNQG